jgi:adenylate cyclase
MAEEVDEIVITSPAELIQNCTRLPLVSTLSLSRSSLIHIPQIIFFLQNLITLDLSSNPISSLNGLWDSKLTNLKMLNISACWLEKLPYGPPSFASSLRTFLLDGNFLHRNPPNFTVFAHLKTLSLIGNDFAEIPPLPRSLEKLYFRMNGFSKVPDCSLTTLDASYCMIPNSLKIGARLLVNLDLSHCSLSGNITFPPIPLLTSVKLCDNAITSLSFESSRRITYLDLSYNALTKVPEFIFKLPTLRHLYLSHNSLNSLPEDLSVMRRLEVLDISHNALITPKLYLPPRLRSLRASFNFSVSFSQFPPSLEEFDASFCYSVAVPPTSVPLKSFSVYFVTAIGFSEHMKPITYQNKEKETTAIAPISMFKLSNYKHIPGPKIDSATMINEQLGDKIGCSATSGRSTKYEDNFMAFSCDGVTYVGVFDGHVGHESAFVAAKTFSTILAKIVSPNFGKEKSRLKEGMRSAFAMVNDELNRRMVKDGTTAVVVCIKDRIVLCGHLGDSLALVVKKSGSKFLTKEHRSTDRAEYASLRRQNKSVSSDWRVDGKLSVSRSLGDFWCCGGMYDTPDVTVFDLDDDCLSIVLACDGLWDYIDAGSVCTVVRSLRDPVKSSRLLQDIAFASGSHDSISVIVVNVDK